VMCIDCGEEEATCGERCRDCDIVFAVGLWHCEHCGRLTNLNNMGQALLGIREPHAPGCPNRTRKGTIGT
jgi:hypothetical protein